MKNFIYLFIFLIIFIVSCGRSNKQYINEDFKYYSKLNSGFQIIESQFVNNQSYLKLTIEDSTRATLLKTFSFQTYDSFLNSYQHSGKISIEYKDLDKPDTNYLYCLQDGRFFREYFVLLLSKTENKLIYFQNFSEP